MFYGKKDVTYHAQQQGENSLTLTLHGVVGKVQKQKKTVSPRRKEERAGARTQDLPRARGESQNQACVVYINKKQN